MQLTSPSDVLLVPEMGWNYRLLTNSQAGAVSSWPLELSREAIPPVAPHSISRNKQCNWKPFSSKAGPNVLCFINYNFLAFWKNYISKEGKNKKATQTPSALTLIMALDVILKSVARSLTCLIFSLLSAGSLRDSSSLRERCSAVPCLAIRSLHVLRSSTLLDKVRRVFCSSVLSVCETDSSSPDSSAAAKGNLHESRPRSDSLNPANSAHNQTDTPLIVRSDHATACHYQTPPQCGPQPTCITNTWSSSYRCTHWPHPQGLRFDRCEVRSKNLHFE